MRPHSRSPDFRARKLYGVDLSLRRRATVGELLSHERTVKAAEQSQFRKLLERFGVPLIRGTATFVDPHTLRVSSPDAAEFFVHGESIVLATGSDPVRPPLFPFGDKRIHDSDELVDLTKIPESLAVVGAGVIGAEYACMFAALGVKTTLVDGRSGILSFLDTDVCCATMSVC